MNAAPAPEEIALDTATGRRAALRWSAPGAPRVLCLHGWLDNAASFVPLAGLLPGLDLVAMDFPGHGRSAHRPAGVQFHFVDYLWDVDAALDALGWPDCALLGHSLGGAVACCYAAAAPRRVRRVAALDAVGPTTHEADDAVSQLRGALASTRRQRSAPRTFTRVGEAVEARLKVTPMAEASARLVVERNLEPVDGGYRWRTDPRLTTRSAQPMTEAHVLSLLGAVACPVLSVAADPPPRWENAERSRRRHEAIADLRALRIAGSHHFHMDAPGEVAATIRAFLDPGTPETRGSGAPTCASPEENDT